MYLAPLIWTVGACALSTEFSQTFSALRAVTPVQIVRFDLLLEVPMEIFAKPDNAIMVKDGNTTILHTSSLNTASRRINGTIFKFNEPREATVDAWFEFRSAGATLVAGEKRPITGCVNSQHGDGALLTGGFNKNFGQSSVMDLKYGFTFGYNLSATLATNNALSSQVTLTASYYCMIKANSTGQIFIQPTLLEYHKPSFRRINVVKAAPWYNPFGATPLALNIGQWQTTDDFKMIHYKSKPIILCVTEDKFLACDEEVFGDPWAH